MRMRRPGIVALACLLVAGGFGQDTTARAEVSDHLGPLAAAVDLGKEGAWTSELTKGWFMLTNPEEPNAIRSYRMTGEALGGGSREVSVNTALRPMGDAPSAAGLLFDYREATEYKAFAIEGDAGVSLFVRSADGLERSATAESAAARMDGSDVLTLVQGPASLELRLNGENVFTLESDDGFSDTFGVIALGKGRFAFDGFSLTETPAVAEADPFPAPGGGKAEEDPFPAPGGGDQASEAGEGEPPPAQKQPQSDPPPQASPKSEQLTEQERYVASVLIGTTFGVLFHELGHAMIGELKLPATGPEEDVADEFSAFILGSIFEDQELLEDPQEAQMLHDIVRYSALVWYYNGLKMEAEGTTEPWQDEHSPSLTRFRNAFCIIYGGNPERYDPLADKVDFPERNRQRCKIDYQKRYSAWERILATVARDLGPDFPGELPPDTPGAKVKVIFEQPTSELGKVLGPLYRDTGAVQEIAQILEKTFVWPRDLTIVFRDCEILNAWYDPEAGSVTMCYGLIEFFSKIVFQAETGSGPQPDQPPAKQEPRQEPRQEPTQQEPTQADAMAYFAGVWEASIPSAWGPLQAQVTYGQDGSYQSVVSGGGTTIQIWGTWTATPLGNGQVQLQSTPQGWSPQQLCDAYNYCQPLYYYPESTLVQVIDENTVRSEVGMWQRVN